MMNKLDEYYGNPLSFTPVNFATMQVPGSIRMTLPDAERAPLGYTVDDEGLVNFRFYYPNAKKVTVHNAFFATELQNENGFFTGKADWGTGFVSCWLMVDGSMVISQFLPLCFAENRPLNFVDIPDGTDIRMMQEVPHGVVADDFLKNSVTGLSERIRIYLPPMYFTEKERRFPVLYLQHGFSENETVWTNQGRINFVLDNLLAAGKIEPVIVVMCNGMMVTASKSESVTDCGHFHEFLIHDVMPHVEKRYRVVAEKENRVMAGFSMGSIQTSRTAFLNPDLFRAIGLFSGFLSDPLGEYNDHLTPEHITAFKESGTCMFRIIGNEDPFMPVFLHDDEIIATAGIGCERRIYHGNHEWNVWRQCFVDFMQFVFGSGKTVMNERSRLYS
ncbi:MAG: alpha/beta hydrolase-fold protein [Clostridiales bacterium]|nr:alpha/beta hydrolase-fold protein [Clostridiales bacterium]